MSQTRQSLTWRNRFCGAFGLCCLLIAVASPAAAPARPPLCAKSQRIEIASQRDWHCLLENKLPATYLVRVDRQRVDVSLALLDARGTPIVKVNSPTMRAGPELLLHAVDPQRQPTLVVATVDRRAPGTVLQVDVENLPSGSPLAEGLAALTASATVATDADRDDSKRRLLDLSRAAAQFRTTSRTELAAEAELRTAYIYYWTLGDWQSAATAAQTAMRSYAQQQDAILESQAAAMRAASLIELARERQVDARSAPGLRNLDSYEAHRLLEKAATTFHAANMPYEEAHALNNLGLAHFYQGSGDQARTRYQQAARLFTAAGERQGEALVFQNLAVLEYERGNYSEAVAGFRALLERLEPDDDVGLYVSVQNNYAIAAGASGHLDQALSALLTTLPLTAKDIDPSHRARTLHVLGGLYLIAGDRERATIFLRQALELRRLETTHDRRGLLSSLIRNGDLERDTGNMPAALALHAEAYGQAVSDSEKARALLALGTDQLLSGSVSVAEETFERALALDLDPAWPVRASLNGGLAQARLLSGDASGRELLMQVAAAHRHVGDNELAAQSYLFLASQDYRTRNLRSALDLVQRAIALYESQRLGAVNPDLRAMYIATRADAYDLQAAIYMTLRDSAPDPAEQERMAMAALASMESLRLHAIEDFGRVRFAPQVAEGSPSTVSIATLDARIAAKRHRLSTVLEQPNPSPERVTSLRRDLALLRSQLDVSAVTWSLQTSAVRSDAASVQRIQHSLDADTALISWLPGTERSWIWCITKQGAEAFQLQGRQKVEDAARALHTRWNTPGVAGDDAEAEQQLSSVLLGSVAACLRRHEFVVVVPDGVLRSVPFGALWLSDERGTSRRVVETHTISYRPALTARQRRDFHPVRSDDRSSILLVGDPVIPDQRIEQAAGYPGQGLRPLPGAGREVSEIASITSIWRPVSLAREQATRNAFLAQPLGEFRVIHFATHALLDVHDPQLSALVLSGPSSLTLRDVMNLQLQTDAVVLGACEGSLGKQYRGQLSLGLSEAFLFAGAHNVVGSLWPVADAATAQYMRAFYQHYVRGETSSAAARTAALSMMKDPRFRHPFYWAAFVNLGS
jgi:CHAT domain-containing protein/tetratricopeptide (TPR) repeat protein